MSYSYKHQNPYLGACLFLFSKKKFIEMAVVHGMACNLESEDQRAVADKRGEEILKKWEKDYREDYTGMTIEINAALWSSFWIMAFLISVALVIAACLGKINATLPFGSIKVTAFIGSALVGWATLMELGNDFSVYDGPSFPQLAHKVIFKTIFLPGIFLILMSVLI